MVTGAMDTELVVRAQQGDETAFAEITAASYGHLQQVAYRVLRDPQLAQDATQRALVRIWQKLPRLRDPACFDAWCYRFVVRACADEAREARRALPLTVTDSERTTGDETARIADHDLLEHAFEQLSVDHRAVIVLHHYLDLTLEATAEALGISVGTAKSRLNRAMTRLRMAMAVETGDAARAPEGAVR
jgi:RNA polymerase sigma-70 factor (ECF subfamily)